MGGIAKSIGGLVTGNEKLSGSNKFNMNDALQYRNPELNSAYGTHTYDAKTNTHTYGQSANDAMRTNLISQMLGNIDPSMMDPKQYQDAYYNQAMTYLQPKMDRDLGTLDEQLINRGIQVGNKQYGQAMGDLRDSQNQQLNQLYSQAILGGIDAANKTTSGLGSFMNQLTDGSDIATLLRMQGLNDSSDLYASMLGHNLGMNQYNNQVNAANTGAGMNALGSIGAAFGFSDERLKENLVHVATMKNGIKIYLGNYKVGTGLGNVTRLFVLAQEVEKIVPEAVKETEIGFKAVDYSLINKEE